MADYFLSQAPYTYVAKSCCVCGAKHRLYVSLEDYAAWQVQRRFVQDVLPHISPEVREVAISGTCPPCWENLWADMEDEEEAEVG